MHKVTKLIVAAAAGFAAGILLAPKSGRETRNDLKRRTEAAREFTNAKAVQVNEAAREAAITLRGGALQVGDEAVEMAKSANLSAAKLNREARVEATKLAGEAKVRATRVTTTAKKTATKIKKDAEKKVK